MERERPAARVVLLGASNLRGALSTVVDASRRVLGAPLEVLVAAGYGRSYGKRASVLGFSLPGIVDSGLWRVLDEGPPRPTYGLLTDVGNDVAYGVSPAVIDEWVGTCLERLRAARATTTVSLLPMEVLAALPRWKYVLMRSVLFPGCRMSRAEAIARAGEVDEALRAKAAETGATTMEPEPSWYGFDPIHIRRSRRRAVWSEIAGRWGPRTSAGGAVRPAGALRLWIQNAEGWWFLGRERRCPQPSVVLPDGTCIGLY